MGAPYTDDPDGIDRRRTAFATSVVKGFDEESREFWGIASTPTADRMKDIVEPLGARFKLPIVLLSKHDPTKPIGTVVEAKVSKKGIEYKAVIPKVSESGVFKDRVDEAWQEIKYGVVRGVSIGFRPDHDEIEVLQSGGLRFKKWEWHELSTVPIPANVEATISRIKSIATGDGASADESLEAKRKPSPGVSGKPVFYTRTKGNEMNIQEQIDALEIKRDELQSERVGIQEKAVSEGRSKDQAESERFDEIGAEVETVEKELKDFRSLLVMQKATPVNGRSQEEASASRAPAIVSKSIRLKEEPGLMLARHALCMFAAKNNVALAAQLAQDHYGDKAPVTQVLRWQGGRSMESIMGSMVAKAAVPAATTTDATWAAPLLAYNTYSADFVEFMRPMTILGQFGLGGVPSANRIPFNVHIKGQTSGGMAYWTGQGAAKPVTKFDFNDVYFGWFKVAAISVATDEMIRFSDPAIEMLIRNGLAAAGAERLNTDFIDPSFAGSANVSPPSILYGLTPIASSGTDADAIRADLMALQASADDANNPLNSMVYVMHPKTAAGLGNMRNPLGQVEFPGITRQGGSLGGVPVIVSGYVPFDTSGGIVALMNAEDLWYADDGQATVDMSNQASIQMLDNPTNNSTGSTTPTTVVSMFQTDSTAFRMHRFANWKRRRESSFAYLTGVNWGA